MTRSNCEEVTWNRSSVSSLGALVNASNVLGIYDFIHVNRILGGIDFRWLYSSDYFFKQHSPDVHRPPKAFCTLSATGHDEFRESDSQLSQAFLELFRMNRSVGPMTTKGVLFFTLTVNLLLASFSSRPLAVKVLLQYALDVIQPELRQSCTLVRVRFGLDSADSTNATARAAVCSSSVASGSSPRLTTEPVSRRSQAS